jgi:hypothetical protein
MNSRSFLLTLFVVVLSAPSACSKQDAPLSALAERVREKQETTKVGTDIAQRLGLRQEEEIPAHGHLVTDGKNIT